MYLAALVGVLQRQSCLANAIGGLDDRQRRFPLKQFRQINSLDVLHDQVGHVPLAFAIVGPDDVGMIQSRKRTNLTMKSRQPERVVHDVRKHDLYGDDTFQTTLDCSENASHAAGPEPLQQAITANLTQVTWRCRTA